MNRYSTLKTYGLALLGLGTLATLNSCELNEAVYSSFDTDELYASGGGAELGLTSVYSPLTSLYYGPSATLASDLSADQTYPRPVVGRDTYTLFSYDPNYTTQKSFSRENESPLYIWRLCYSGIELANNVIAKVPNANMDAARQKTIIAEAAFLRAFYHFMLTKNFGDVVVKTTVSNSLEAATTGKSPKAEVYKQIFADLDLAAAALPSGPGVKKGTPSKEAALALHAKAALYAEDYPRALDKAKQVINSGKYSLMPNVLDLYNVELEDAARVENLWAFESERVTGGISTYIMGLYGPRNSDGPAYGRSSFGSVFAYQSFFNSFSRADKRRALLDTTYLNAAGARVPQRNITPVTTQGVLVKKYQDPNSNGDANNCNIPLLRLADVYLVAAEAACQATGATPEAYGYLNVVRRRAGLPDLTPGLDRAAFVEAVLQERSWELFAEGDRWYDLTRTGKFLTVIPKAVNNVYPVRTPLPKHKYFPIPQDEINANPKITQNPDWQ